jgi:hypothetical protein
VVERRWDNDERGRGIASGAAFIGHVVELADLMRGPGWATEDPEAHLLPHLRAANDDDGSLLRLDRTWSDGEIFVVEMSPAQSALSVGRLRRAAVELVATIAEESTHIRQRREGDVLVFDVATGSGRDGRFAPHGHLVRLRIDLRG